MVFSSRAADPSSRSKRSEADQGKEGTANLSWRLSQLKKQIQASRLASIKEKIEKNRKSLQAHTCQLFDVAAAAEAATRSSSRKSEGESLLSVRVGNAPCRLGGWDWLSGVGDKEIIHHQEEVLLSSTKMLVIGSSSSNKAAVRLHGLPFVEKIPPYTTWIFLNKNQRMAEDQSVVGRRRIYYDPYGSEALICSDTDEEIAEAEEERHEFTEGEDQIVLKALKDHGPNQEVMSILRQFIDATPDEIEERYEILIARGQKHEDEFKGLEDEDSAGNQFFEKTLNTALDSFDYLFCRRCLIFDCRLHGCSQSLIIPSEKQSSGSELEDVRRPCGRQCYLRGREDIQDLDHDEADAHEMVSKQLAKEVDKSLLLESEDSNPDDNTGSKKSDGICIEVSRGVSSETRSRTPDAGGTSAPGGTMKDSGKRKMSDDDELYNPDPRDKSNLGDVDKRQKLTNEDISTAHENLIDRCSDFINSTECQGSEAASASRLLKECMNESIECRSRSNRSAERSRTTEVVSAAKDVAGDQSKNTSGSRKEKAFSCWNTIEKDLYFKGVEMFGKNSCLISRNLLFGLKSCIEVANYMFNDGASTVSRPLSSFYLDDSGKEDQEYMVDQDMPTRTRLLRRRGKTRKLKYTWKSAGHPSIRKRISNGKQQSCKLYTPCGCNQMCGKECPCMINGTCCEKYCGCSKSCKNRFRGCHCAKSQCRSRQCPCFAAGRECDPDVCRNCWVSCGDGSLGEPPARGDGYQCGNMNLLLKQQKRILLARSDVAGWGAFIKNPVNKNDYLGEYTGELISHKEADKRGKIYDRANSSFLFDLNDQFVLDAYREGDKLKFANHSSNPNCYAKVMLVAGDHRVGIFAKEHIEASEELFYDYRYGPDQAPAWARRPEGSKRDDPTSHSRAHKVA